VTADYFQRLGVPIELIELSGSVELAPVLGLAHHIVDLVETGRTLRDNGLVVVDTIAESTARLIVNRASYHLKRIPVMALIKLLRDAVRTAPQNESNQSEPAPAVDRVR
jgi:ATP phosphoribosyltransferase